MIERLLPEAASAEAAMLDGVLVAAHWHMAAVFLVWLAIFVTALVRFRASRHPVARTEGPPLLLGRSWRSARSSSATWSCSPRARCRPGTPVPAPPAAGEPLLEVRVEAEQFAWHIHYPGPDGQFRLEPRRADQRLESPWHRPRRHRTPKTTSGCTNVLVVPLNRTIAVQLTSRDVVHGFTLPEMRVKQDAVPGFVSRTWFTPVTAGLMGDRLLATVRARSLPDARRVSCRPS